jgi:hypothetical protein
MKNISMIVLFALFVVITGFQPSDKKEKKAKHQLEMAKLIQDRHFRFIPNSASSCIGNINDIIPGYSVVFDSLIVKANLPYYGRSAESYYRFTNGVKFEIYTPKINNLWNQKKKIYTITINLKKDAEFSSIILSVDLNGFATLKITFINQELICYYGIIEKI